MDVDENTTLSMSFLLAHSSTLNVAMVFCSRSTIVDSVPLRMSGLAAMCHTESCPFISLTSLSMSRRSALTSLKPFLPMWCWTNSSLPVLRLS